MIFLSKTGSDQYVNMMAHGCNCAPVALTDFEYASSNEPIVLRGILKHKIIKRCWNDQRSFFYVDTGYFGNEKTQSNPNGWKHWHRVVPNDLQHSRIVDRPDDRFKVFGKQFLPWKKTGSKILIAAPDEKPCKFYGINREVWLTETISKIKEFTDRPIVVRDRPKQRAVRIGEDSFVRAVHDDVFALVTFNSIAAVESVFQGIPVFTLAPTHAASSVGLQDLSRINTPYYPEHEVLYKWASCLAYGQFHIDEMKSGKIWEILAQEF